MKSDDLPGVGSSSRLESDVLEYLRDNPDFFTRHPRFVERLKIPHSCDGAVSLVQYQVALLRDRTQHLRRSMQELLANARANEKLSARLHRLTLLLMECRRLDEVFECLYQALYTEFKADAAILRLFTMPREDGDEGHAEFSADSGALIPRFRVAFEGGNPICGHLHATDRTLLFGPHADDISSAVVVPLKGSNPIGVMAIGSRDPDRFHPAMGTLFLRQLGDIITRVTAPFVVSFDA